MPLYVANALDLRTVGLRVALSAILAGLFGLPSEASQVSASINQIGHLQSSWSLSGSHFLSQPMREDQKSLAINILSATYAVPHSVTKTSTFSFELSHSFTFSDYKDEQGNEIDSLSLSFDQTKEYAAYNHSFISYGLSLGLPASSADRNASLNATITTPLSVSVNPYKHQKISLSAAPTFYSYRYKTADTAGNIYNKKLSLLLSVSHNWSFPANSFSWSNSVSYFDYTNFSEKSFQSYSLSSLLTYRASKDWSFVGGVVSRDRVYTTNYILADDTIAFRTGVSWLL